jgi:hypothetical protein
MQDRGKFTECGEKGIYRILKRIRMVNKEG